MIYTAFLSLKKQVLLLTFSMLSLSVLSQQKQTQITGNIFDLIHELPISNATISIYQYHLDHNSKGKPILGAKSLSKHIATLSSDSNGHFSSSIIPRYTTDYIYLVIESPGMAILHKNHITIEPGKTITLQLALTPSQPDNMEEQLIEAKLEKAYIKQEEEKMMDYTELSKLSKRIPFSNTMDFSEKSSDCTAPDIPTNVYVSNLHNGYNSSSSTTNGYTGYINFDDYVAGVVQAEIGGITTNIETKKAQAIAARTFSMNRHLNGLAVNIGQAYNDSPNATSLTSSSATHEQIIMYNGEVIDAKYSARCNGDYTQNATAGTWAPYNNCNTSGNYIPYLLSRPCSGHDNCSQFGETPCCNATISTSGVSGYIYGHGVGMCQRGIEQWGEIHNLNYCDILNKYYTNVCITHTNCGDSGTSSLDCNNAISLTCNTTYSGNASNAVSQVNSYGCNNWTETGPERVHSFTPDSDGAITATISNFTGDLDVYILGSCNPSDCLGTVASSSATYTDAKANQTYYIVVDADDGSGSAYDLIINCGTSEEQTFKDYLKVFPNPTEGIVKYQFLTDGYDLQYIRVYDSKMMPMPFENRFNTSSINISKLPSGIYFIEFINSLKETAFYKIIKK